MTDQPKEWLLASGLARMKVADLQRLIDQIHGEQEVDSYPGRRKEMIKYIEQKRCDYWDAKHTARAPKPTPRRRAPSKSAAPSLCKIPAREVDAFLRTLPPFQET